MFAFDHTGKLLPGFPVPLRDAQVTDSTRSTPAIGDIDGDGHREILLMTDLAKLWAVKDNGEVPENWPKYMWILETVFPRKSVLKGIHPAVADVDYDGEPEVVAPGYDRGIFYMWAIDGNGEPTPGWPFVIDADLYNIPTIDDIDGDGALEMVLHMQGIVHCLHLNRGGSNVEPLLPWRMYHHDPFRTGNAHAWLPILSRAYFERSSSWVGPDRFTFFVHYLDHDGDAPDTAELVLVDESGDVTTHPMYYSPRGTIGESAFNGWYEVTLSLAEAGEYGYGFHFSDGYLFHYKRADETEDVWLPSRHTKFPGPIVSDLGPSILAAGFQPSCASAGSPTEMRVVAYIDHPLGSEAVEHVEVLYNGQPTGIVLNDDGARGDETVGDSMFTCALELPPGTVEPGGSYPLEMVARDVNGNESTPWPLLPSTTSRRSHSTAYSLSQYSLAWTDDRAPEIIMGGSALRKLDPNAAAYLRLIAVVDHPDGASAIQQVSVHIKGIATGLYLTDDGTSGDELAGDGIFTLVLQPPEVDVWGGSVLELLATDYDGNSSLVFPYLWGVE